MLIYPGRLFKTWTTIPTTIPVMAMAAGIAMLMIHFIVFNSARRNSIFASSAPISALVAKCVICPSKFAIRSPSVLVCTAMRDAPLFKIGYSCSITDVMISRHSQKRKNKVFWPRVFYGLIGVCLFCQQERIDEASHASRQRKPSLRFAKIRGPVGALRPIAGSSLLTGMRPIV